MADHYVRLSHAEYKAVEKAMKEFKETVHTTTTGFYHKSIRIPLGDGTIEFHGPAVMAAEEFVDQSVQATKEGIDSLNAGQFVTLKELEKEV